MSGTEGGATALHVTPEAAIGGPMGLVRDGDEIVLDATTGRLDLLVEDRELARRASEARPGASTARRGDERLYLDHVLQADQGCDFDFLVGPRLRGRRDPIVSSHFAGAVLSLESSFVRVAHQLHWPASFRESVGSVRGRRAVHASRWGR